MTNGMENSKIGLIVLRVVIFVVVWVIPVLIYLFAPGFVNSVQFQKLIANPFYWYLVTICVPTLLYIETVCKMAKMQSEIDNLK